MADDLGDEWWLQENTENEETTAQNKAKTESTLLRERIKKRKRHKSKTEQLNPGRIKEIHEVRANKKPKKKQNKRNKEETAEKTINGKDIPKIFWSSFSKAVEGKLTSLELEDLRVEDEMFITDPSVHTGDLKELSFYLNTVLPDWSKLVRKIDAKDSKGSPGLLLITSAATRATDVLRASSDFRQNGKTVKLFSKHIKLEEQQKHLQEHIVHFGVGTPNRIYKLIRSGSLSLANLKSCVLDWTWRDAKQRQLMDIPEIQHDLVTLLKEVFLVKARKRKIRIGLF